MRILRLPLLLLVLLLLPSLSLAAADASPDAARLARMFDERGLDGCFVLQRGAETFRLNPQRAATRFRPASTYKIVNALAALESGVAPDTDFLLRWDGEVREFPAWNSDLTLEQAFRASAVWYFIELGRLNGRERLGAAMRALSYGNADASGSDQFWLDGPLRISADEQVRSLNRLARGDVPFSPRTLGLMRKIMLLEKGVDAGGPWALYGKSGVAVHGAVPGDARDATPVGWLVGYVERGGEIFPFALNASPKPGSGLGWRDLLPVRLELARGMLAACGVLPPR